MKTIKKLLLDLGFTFKWEYEMSVHAQKQIKGADVRVIVSHRGRYYEMTIAEFVGEKAGRVRKLNTKLLVKDVVKIIEALN